MRHAVPVQEDQIIARCRLDGLVQDDGFAEALVRVPDMADGTARLRLPLVHQPAGRLRGTVIGDKNLVGPARLPGQTLQDLRQRVRLVIGADDQRNLHRSEARFKSNSRSLE